MPNIKALSLFSKDGKGVLQRMTVEVKNALSNKDEKFLRWFEEETGLTKNDVERLKKGHQEIDFQLFEQVKEVLGLSICEILGQPSFNDGERGYWSKQQNMMPMVLTAPVKEPANTRSVRGKNDDAEKRELRFYVRRRAIHELAWDE